LNLALHEAAIVDALRAIDDSDDALMARVAARDAAALRLLADRHAALPWRIAYRMLADRAEAEDVAQEALLRLWQAGEKWLPGGPGVAAWLHRVATNLCLDRLRRRRFASDEEVPERADESPLADAEIEGDEVRAVVVGCIQALPDRQRAAIVLTYYEESANQSAAATLAMQIKAFESLLFRARAALRGCIESKGVLAADIGKVHT
jgi:RNA polymerase sigma factor (sigma-70 family)